jgi:hypothetical protein
MSFLTELFNPTFFLFLGILLLVLSLFTLYYESKFRDQNHKLSSMLNIVSSLAEEVNNVKFSLNQVALMGGGKNVNYFQPNLAEMNITKKLIEVSDDEQDEEDDNDSENDSDNDDEDSDNEDSENEDSDNDDEDDEDEDDNDDDDSDTEEVIDLNNINVIELGQHKDITILKMGKTNEDSLIHLDITMSEFQNIDENNLEELDDLDDLEQFDDLESVSTEEGEDNVSKPLEINNGVIINNMTDEFADIKVKEYDLEQHTDLNDLKKINIMDLDDTKSIQTSEANDYKKMSVQKLKSLVVERNLAADSSKLKKNELLKLLEEE